MSTGPSLSAYFGGGGHIVSVAVPDPGPGLNFSQVVPANNCWSLQTASFLLTTDATVSTRVLRIRMRSVGAIVFEGGAGSQNGGFSFRYSVAPNLEKTVIFGFSVVAAVPLVQMFSGDVLLETAIINLQPGDALTAIQLLVRQYTISV